jgi:hypothetical protein
MTAPHRNLFKISLAALLGLSVTGCISFSGGPTPLPTITPPVTSDFYLRIWQTQALPPQTTFGWLPSATIANSQFIDGMVAIPMIYPGPIYVGLSQQSISEAGITAIINRAQVDGLLGPRRDFTEIPMPGSITAHLTMTVGGTTYDLTGPLLTSSRPASTPTPGSTAAFEDFYNQLQTLSLWLRSELGQSTSYIPSSVAFMLTPPAEVAAPLAPAEVRWPLAGNFAAFGVSTGMAGYRCAVLSGQDLVTLLPVVQDANALTRFVDASGAKMSLVTRVVLPGEEVSTVC